MTTRWIIRLLASVSALTIANLYYCQPLLPEISRSYGDDATVGLLPGAGQLGYLLALVLVVPLGDIVRRRTLVRLLLCADAAALAVTAVAPTAGVLLAATVVVGVASAGVVNVLVSYAATLAGPGERALAVATMLTGGLIGILLSRTLAGLVADLAGWRALFAFAALIAVLLAALVSRVVASAPPEVAIGYARQLRATARLAVREPVLRRRAFIGACAFAAFSVFWATVAFRLAAPPHRFGEAQIGLFALVGLAGALAAQMAGRAAGRGRQRLLTALLLVLGAVSFGAIGQGGEQLIWLVVGLLAMDAAVHGTHLLNLNVVYGLVDGARSRVASAYMTVYTLGGVIGAVAGTAAYRTGDWGAVCVLGAAFMLAGLVLAVRGDRPGPEPDSAGPHTVSDRRFVPPGLGRLGG
ncbi:MFS transporter [Spirillospora sp. CA-294931]|uniref:MFS transporter n=1 Tax=Spirillospora sp. CA-294931 TaxID=3240042 RepID=UPI003D8B9E41